MEDIVPVLLALFIGFFGGAIFWGLKTPKHCGLNAHKCRKTRARLDMWAKRYKRKVEELSHDVRSDS